MSGLKRNILVIFILLIISTAVQANAGTALMWATGIHLLIGNLFIGVLEGLLLAKWYDISESKCIGIFILANYFSAWLGGFIILKISPMLPVDINNMLPMFLLMIVASYILTIILEFPFAVFAFKGDNEWLKKSIRGTFLVQTISYVILFGWFGIASRYSLFTKTNIVSASAIQLPDNVQLYFISADDGGDINTGYICDRKWKNIYDLNSINYDDYLIFDKLSDNKNLWDFIAIKENTDISKSKYFSIQKELSLTNVPSENGKIPDSLSSKIYSNYSKVPTLGIKEKSSWEFHTSFWPSDGLKGSNSKLRERVTLAVETPFVTWSVRNAVQLSNDTVLFQLGDNQICVYDPNTKQVALLAYGYGPIAVIKK